jgi:hypothetical protein
MSIEKEVDMELPLAAWMEWVVAGGSVVVGGVVLKVLNRIQR